MPIRAKDADNMRRGIAPESSRRKLRRRTLLRWAGATGFAGGGVLAWGALFEAYHPVVERVTVRLPDLPPSFHGYRIALLSDLHLQPGFAEEALRPAFDLANAQRPDLVLLLGDYVNDRAPAKAAFLERCAAAVAALKAPDGTWAVFGNHDYPDPPVEPDVRPWRAAGIHTLNGEVGEVTRRGERLFLVGLRSFIVRPVTPSDLLNRVPASAARIVLWHEPDRAPEAATAGASLQLSGHTHGGQVRLPLVGPPFLPAGGRRYRQGLYRVGPMPLYVTRGVGLLPPRVRLNCRPEVTLLTLEAT